MGWSQDVKVCGSTPDEVIYVHCCSFLQLVTGIKYLQIIFRKPTEKTDTYPSNFRYLEAIDRRSRT